MWKVPDQGSFYEVLGTFWKPRPQTSEKSLELSDMFDLDSLRRKCTNLVDVADIFYFFCSGERKGESEAAGEGAGRFLIENPRRGVSQAGGGGGGEGVCGELLGGGLFFFRRGRNSHQEKNT